MHNLKLKFHSYELSPVLAAIFSNRKNIFLMFIEFDQILRNCDTDIIALVC